MNTTVDKKRRTGAELAGNGAVDDPQDNGDLYEDGEETEEIEEIAVRALSYADKKVWEDQERFLRGFAAGGSIKAGPLPRPPRSAQPPEGHGRHRDSGRS